MNKGVVKMLKEIKKVVGGFFYCRTCKENTETVLGLNDKLVCRICHKEV